MSMAGGDLCLPNLKKWVKRTEVGVVRGKESDREMGVGPASVETLLSDCSCTVQVRAEGLWKG